MHRITDVAHLTPTGIAAASSAERRDHPAQFCRKTIDGIKRKADHNKSESLFLFTVVIASTLIAPLFITLGSQVFWAKIVPSVLSVAAAGATAWLQLRRPQHLWALYRTAQRELEDQETKHTYRLADYAEASDPDRLLAERVAATAINLHQQWIPMIPNPETLKAIESNTTRVHKDTREVPKHD